MPVRGLATVLAHATSRDSRGGASENGARAAMPMVHDRRDTRRDTSRVMTRQTRVMTLTRVIADARVERFARARVPDEGSSKNPGEETPATGGDRAKHRSIVSRLAGV